MNKPETYTTYREIEQQPKLWEETLRIIKDNRQRIKSFFDKIKGIDKPRVILTGAGSSAYIGESALPYIIKYSDYSAVNIPTTDIVSNPEQYLQKHRPTILVSYARSGNSPESTATLNLVNQLVDEVYHIVVTCNKEGELAQKIMNDPRSLLITMPSEANDQGLAMTGSYSTMLLATILIFRTDRLDLLEGKIKVLADISKQVLRHTLIETLSREGFQRMIFLGSGPLKGLAKEAELKMLELNAGEVITKHESPLGFRHGPKSIVDKHSLVCVFLSNDAYTRQYDVDLVHELIDEEVAKTLTLTAHQDETLSDPDYSLDLKIEDERMDDSLIYFPYLVFAQKLAFMTAYHQGKNPDNPSPKGIINRVVKGVRIHPYGGKGGEDYRLDQ